MLPQQLGFALEILARHGLRPWLDTGTALGIAREGRILWGPGEDDIDLSLWAEDESKLASAAGEFESAGYAKEIWSWRGLTFKWKFMPTAKLTAYPIDVKLYRRVGDDGWTPLVYQRTPPTKPLWLVWNAWRARLLAHDSERKLGQWPWTACFGVHTFRVPAHFFDELECWRGTSAYLPRELDAFLQLHYGDWRRPVRGWDASTQDGSVVRGDPGRVFGAAVRTELAR